MPFTAAHPAAVLPLLRARGLAPSGLVVGTLVPDIPVFTGAWADFGYTFSHSWLWSVPFALVTGSVLLSLFAWAKVPLLELLPEGLRAKLRPLAHAQSPRSLRRALSLALSLALGALTHVAWDAFTHTSRLGSRLWPALESIWIERSLIGPLPGFRVLQYASSVAGMMIVAAYGYAWLAHLPEGPRAPSVVGPRTRSFVGVLAMAIIPATTALAATKELVSADPESVRAFVVELVTGTIVGQGFLLLLAAIGIKAKQARASS